MRRHTVRHRKWIAAGSLTLLVALVPGLLAAQPPGPRGRGGFMHHGPGMGQGPGFERLAERLDLASDQLEAIRAVRQSHREELHSAFEEVQSAQWALRQQIHAEVFDETAIREAAGALGLAEAEAAVQRARVSQEVRDVLTAEQQQELRELLEQRRAFMEDNASRFKERFSESEP